jgi:tripartite-type tricarboxylate transporter receptor subunit TctC
MISRRTFLKGSAASLLGSAIASTPLAHASAEHPVTGSKRLIFGYPPGASGSRLAAGCLPLLDAGYRLENIEGRNTRTASNTVRSALPDGETLLQVISSSLTLFPSVYKNLEFDPLTDFAPVALMGDFPYALAVGPLVPRQVTTVSHYLQWVADNPDARNIGVSIYGSIGHLAVRILARESGAAVRVQPYGSTNAVIQDLSDRNLAAAFLAPGNGLSVDGSTPMRVIGVTSRQRLSYWSQLPSLAEQGINNMDITGWFGWFAPAATPANILQPLRERIAVMQKTPAYAALQQQLLLTPVSQSPAQISARMREEIQVYRSLVDTYRISKMD